MRTRIIAHRISGLVAVVVVLAGVAQSQIDWVGSWAASQQLVEPHNAVPAGDLKDVTLRQIVHLSVGGSTLRLQLSNRYGSAPLHFDSVHIARAASPAEPKIQISSDQPVTFSGRPDVTIPAGADYVSDPIQFSCVPFSDLAITLHLETMPEDQTGHPGSRATSYLMHGDSVAAAEMPDAKKIEHWYFISEIDVASPSSATSIVTLGDSITDGHGATTNGNDRWPDVLARRLQSNAATRGISVLNEGIGGNRLLLNGLGPNALARFDHDVLAPAGARYVIVLEGVNDIGMLDRTGEATAADHERLVQQIIGAYQQIILRSHAHGMNVFGCTILPFTGSEFYHPSAAGEADRQAINKWIRTPGHFDAVIDFDELMRDAKQPDRLLAKYDSGDHLHPSPEGYAAMAAAVPLRLFSDRLSESPGRGPRQKGKSRSTLP